MTLSIASLTALVGCSEQVDEPDAPSERTARQALVNVFAPGPSLQQISEGGTAQVDIQSLCVDTDADPDVDVEIDWGDGSTNSRVLAVGVQDVAGAVCGPGQFVVCDETGTFQQAPGCAGWLHEYADNGPGANGAWQVSMEATHQANSAAQNLTVEVANLDPNINSLTRTGARLEGVLGNFDLSVEDPGLLANEISGVVWQWTPANQVLDPTTITCDCAAAPHCDDGTNLDVCGETDAPETDTKSTVYLDDGPYSLTVTVTDKDGGSSSRTVNTTINNQVPSNLDILIGGISVSQNSGLPTELVEGTTYTIVGTGEDRGIDQLDFTWDYGDTQTFTGTGVVTKASYPNITMLTPPNILTPTHTWDSNGPSDDYQLSLNIADDDGGSIDNDTFVRIRDVDPIIDGFTANGQGVNPTVSEGGTVRFEVAARSGAQNPGFDDLPTNAYSWNLDSNPLMAIPNEVAIVDGCTSSDSFCELRFVDADTSAVYEVDVVVSDEDSTTASSEFGVTVENVLPSITEALISPPSISESQSAGLVVSFNDPAGTLDGSYELSIDWGDGSTDTVTQAGAGTFATQTHTYADNKDCAVDGTCTVEVQVCESGGALCSAVVTRSISIANVSPTVSAASPGPLVEGVYFSLDGGFGDPAGGKDDTYSWVWSGTDNAGAAELSGTASYGSRTSDVDVNATPTSGGFFDNVPATGLANVPIVLAVTDADGGQGVAVVNVNVADNKPSIDNIAQAFVPAAANDEPATPELTIDVSAQTDADLLSQVVVDWGDGSPVTTDVSIAGTGANGTSVTITKPAPYGDSGTYTATVTLSDEDSITVDTVDITVDNVAPTISLVETTPPAPVIVAEGQNVSVRVTGTDPSLADANALIFQVDWGDGTTDFATGTQTGNPNEAQARFTHTYTDPNVYPVSITLTDKDGGSDSDSLNIEVLNRAPTITDVFNTGPVDENTEVTTVMLVNNPGADTLSYNFNFNCNTTSENLVADGDFVEQPGSGGTSAVSQNTYPQNGTYNVCVRVCDDDGPNFGCSYGLTTVRVDNVAPTITDFPTPAPVDEAAAGANVPLTVTATDVGPNDTLTYAFDCESDGTPDVTGPSNNTVCTYNESGTYTATVTVTDGDGGTTREVTTVRVRNLAPRIDSFLASIADEGTATSFGATAIDDGGDSLTYSYDIDNDGVYETNSSSDTFNYRYPTDGDRQATLRVCDDDNACVTQTVNVSVNNVAPVINNVLVPSTVTKGSSITVVAEAADAGQDTLSYLFTFRDSGNNALFSIGPQPNNVASTTIDQTGAYSVEVAVTDVASAPNQPATVTASQTFSVTDVNVLVNAVANPASITEGGQTTISVDSQGTAPYLVSYDINGDGDFDDPQDITPSGPTDTCDPCSEQVSYPNNRPGDLPFRVLVQVTDADGAVATAIVSVTVRNQAPVLAAVNNTTITEDENLNVTLSATDVGVDDDISYNLVSGPMGVMVTPDTGIVTWDPTYANEGNNTIVVSAIDSDGAASEQSFTVTVTIVDTNNNGVSDNLEIELNGSILPPNADTLDSDSDGVSDLDEVLAGTDPQDSDAPTAPILLSPVDDTVSSLRPRLTVVNAVSPRDEELTYTFVVNDSAGTEVTRIADVPAGRTTTSATVDVDLGEDADYEWFAFASDQFADGPDSELGNFKVNASNVAPPAPENLLPRDAVVLPSGALAALELRAVLDPDGDEVFYRFQIATSDTFDAADIVLESELRRVPFLSLAEPLDAGTYYWRGLASDGANDSDFSASTSFTIDMEMVVDVNTAPVAPEIVGPFGEFEGESATLTIEESSDAEGDALQYEFEFATNSAFANATSSGLQAELTFDVDGLEEGVTYHWRVRADDGQLSSAWSSSEFFIPAPPVVEPEVPDSAPYGLALLTPSNDALLQSAPSAFTWLNATDEDGDTLTYTIVVSGNEDLSEPIIDEEVDAGQGTTSYEPSADGFELGETYYWSVTVVDEDDNELSVSGTFSLYLEPEIPEPTDNGGSNGEEEGGCGCRTVAQPTDSTPIELVGFALLGLLGLRRRRKN